MHAVLYKADLGGAIWLVIILFGIIGKIIKKFGGDSKKPAKSGSVASAQDQLSQFLQSIADQPVAPVATVQRSAAPPQQRMPPPVPRQAAPAPQAPSLDKTGEAAEKQRDGAMTVSTDDMVRPRSRPSRGIARAIRRELVDSDGLRRAIVLSEILGPPVGLKKQS